jgi:argininosuccinate lyase
MSDLVKRYTSSVDFDKRLWQADIRGSLAHAGMLAAAKTMAMTAYDLLADPARVRAAKEEFARG